MSDYYTYGNTLIPNTTASANDVKAEFQKVETGLAKLPSVNELNRSTRNYIGIAGGSADVYTGTLSHVASAYQDGQEVFFEVDAAKVNTGASTLNISSIGADAIVYSDGSAMIAGELSGIHHVKYSTTLSKWALISVSPVSAAAAAASASAAATSETNAAASETAAGVSETNAAASAAAAAASAATLLNTKVIEIGDWDMDTTVTIAISHGLTQSKIRTVAVTVRNDVGAAAPFSYNLNSLSWGRSYATATQIFMSRTLSEGFDNTDFSDTSYNRGWVTIQYTD